MVMTFARARLNLAFGCRARSTFFRARCASLAAVTHASSCRHVSHCLRLADDERD